MLNKHSSSNEKPILSTLTSWLDNNALPENLATEDTKESIDYWRVIPFVALHLACFALFWVGYSTFSIVFAIVLYALRMFAINRLDYLGLLLFLLGFLCETVADWQLTQFKDNPNNKGKVLNTGLWYYSRHPNYFGECCIWWGVYLIALAGGAWWAIVSPILMTLLLLKISGVSLLEKDIAERRPAYVEYIKNTNIFIPGLPKNK